MVEDELELKEEVDVFEEDNEDEIDEIDGLIFGVKALLIAFTIKNETRP